ncbi:alpha/beta-type small acid-soluble spore protein [Paratissierella segnis]|jgi:hypothetical protein|uniref:Alpha/beta-type small acid-soluble spore protein n=1 Tax=Paratissierella segnis TaxID=2763679 RepID=A0A926EXT1_9FIRM|nr:alpha/beta-type small acid-soluble spore protein [Paratissierella segnis]MBC8588205.1 alpha/beta-type small acid-soluble spore protein [Paratissierella segnis]
MASNNNSNRILNPNARQALNQMKLEIASELGLSNYDSIDKGQLPSRENGYVGGYMTRRLVEQAQNSLAGTPGTQSQTPTQR